MLWILFISVLHCIPAIAWSRGHECMYLLMTTKVARPTLQVGNGKN